MPPELISPELWSRIITEAMIYLNMNALKLGETLGVDWRTIYAWKNKTRTTPAKRMEGYQRRLLRLGVPAEIVYGSKRTGQEIGIQAPPALPPKRPIERRRRTELRRVFRVIEKMMEKQNTKMTQELKGALARLLRVEANEVSGKKSEK